MAKKYIDADLLRKAVEKQIDYAKGVYPKGSMEEARASAITAVYRNILASIDSLQQEQPCGDLKIALIQQEITRLYDKYSGKNILGPECIVLDKLDEFIDTLKEKSSSTDLDEEIKRYIPRDQCPVPDFMEAVARHFAEWQKKQMMKEAVEGIARPDDCEIWVNLVGYGYKFNDGDKIKIVVIPNKEEKK